MKMVGLKFENHLFALKSQRDNMGKESLYMFCQRKTAIQLCFNELFRSCYTILNSMLIRPFLTLIKYEPSKNAILQKRYPIILPSQNATFLKRYPSKSQPSKT